jgi:hypothetical protein
LHEQYDQLALAMRIGLRKYGFQLIARRLPSNFQLAGGNIGKAPRPMTLASFASEGVRPNVLAASMA